MIVDIVVKSMPWSRMQEQIFFFFLNIRFYRKAKKARTQESRGNKQQESRAPKKQSKTNNKTRDKQQNRAKENKLKKTAQPKPPSPCPTRLHNTTRTKPHHQARARKSAISPLNEVPSRCKSKSVLRDFGCQVIRVGVRDEEEQIDY